jgi:trehalose synthase
MAYLHEISIAPRSFDRFSPIVGQEPVESLYRVAGMLQERLTGRTVWNVNSTAAGGGVAEMLPPLLEYIRGAGIDARWVVITGTPEFFRATKRLHHALHNAGGDGSLLGDAARGLYERVTRDNAEELIALIRPRDFVVLHDPQTAGMAPHLARAGALVVWRCHVGHDDHGPDVERAWSFLSPYLQSAHANVFSREGYVPTQLRGAKNFIIPPSIDPFSAKNQDLDQATVRAILVHVGFVEGPAGTTPPTFHRIDGTPARVDRCADLIRLGETPPWDRPLVVQVSRWDPLKDPLGVMQGFVEAAERFGPAGAHLVLAGPNVTAVADDPEGAVVFDEVVAAWRALPHHVRGLVTLASLPMADIEENAAIVNALQRHAAVIVQKSLHEGFGLTVTEAMWKGRPIVASRVGGIQDQIEDGKQGLLIDDPQDRHAFGQALGRVICDPVLARRLGDAARERARADFLGVRHLLQYARLIEDVDG